jgi:hypothetical protein
MSITEALGCANYADSYDPEINPVTGKGTWCTGKGLVGTDGAFNFSGLAPNGSCHAEPNPYGQLNKKVTVDSATMRVTPASPAASSRIRVPCTFTW